MGMVGSAKDWGSKSYLRWGLALNLNSSSNIFLRARTGLGGWDENAPIGAGICTLCAVGGTVWERLEGVGLLEEESLGSGLEVSTAHAIPS